MSAEVRIRRGSWLRERRGIMVLRVLEEHELYVVATNADGTEVFHVYRGDTEQARA